MLWTFDLDRGTRTRVTFPGDNHDPIWRADGQLTWGGQAQAVRGIRMGRVDRAAQAVSLGESRYERVPESWSPDGSLLALTETHPDTGDDIWLLSIDSGDARPFAVTAYKEAQARFSRNGRWIAYASDESGRLEVYVQAVASDGERLPISSSGGNSPLWSPDGRELFYVEGSQLMVVDIDLEQRPVQISRPPPGCSTGRTWERFANYDITPDGRRFLFVRRNPAANPAATLRVLLNWRAPQVSRAP